MSEGAAQFNIHDAKTNLSRLVERVENGEEIIISRAGVPVARLVPLQASSRAASRGSLRGQLRLADDWDSEATNAAAAEAFYE